MLWRGQELLSSLNNHATPYKGDRETQSRQLSVLGLTHRRGSLLLMSFCQLLLIYPLLTSTTLHHCTLSLLRYNRKSIQKHVQFFSSSSHHCKGRETLWQYSEYVLPPPPLLSQFLHLPLPLSPFSPSLYDDWQYNEIPLERSLCSWAGHSQAFLPWSHLLDSKEGKKIACIKMYKVATVTLNMNDAIIYQYVASIMWGEIHIVVCCIAIILAKSHWLLFELGK